MYLKRIIDCVIKWCRILDSLVTTIVAITTWLATTIISIKTIVIITIQSTIVVVSITSFTITTTCNFITTSGDNYGNIIIGNQVNTNSSKTISIQNCITTLEDSFTKTTIVELIKIPNDETTIAPIETYTMTSNIINVTG